MRNENKNEMAALTLLIKGKFNLHEKIYPSDFPRCNGTFFLQ